MRRTVGIAATLCALLLLCALLWSRGRGGTHPSHAQATHIATGSNPVSSTLPGASQNGSLFQSPVLPPALAGADNGARSSDTPREPTTRDLVRHLLEKTGQIDGAGKSVESSDTSGERTSKDLVMQLLEKVRQERLDAGKPFDPTLTNAWRAGFRPAEKLAFTHSLTVTLMGLDGPVRHGGVVVTYVESYSNPHGPMNPRMAIGESVRDADGAVWISRCEDTDENGTAHFDGLPYVQCKVESRNAVLIAFPDSAQVIHVQTSKEAEDN